jgi:hypothetical protein
MAAPIRIALCLAPLVLTPAGSALACNYNNTSFFPGSNGEAGLSVKSGETCRFAVGFAAVAAGNYEFVRADVSVRAKNGVGARSDLTTFAYKSNPGYVGKDYFQIVLQARVAGRPATSRLNVYVTVTG